jgi:ATP-dependent DNA helicase RecG
MPRTRTPQQDPKARQGRRRARPACRRPAQALRRLGCVRDIDLALHLPLRYEDETRSAADRRARDGETVQVEGVVSRLPRRVTRSRRQLLVHLPTTAASCCCASCTSTPPQQKRLAEGARLRVRGELRGGFFGREMVHPAVKVAEGTPLPQR